MPGQRKAVVGRLRLCDALIRCAGRLVPGRRRGEWLREWRAELWHEATRTAGEPGPGAVWRLLGRSLGALPDAVAMRRFHPAPVEEDLGSALRVVAGSPGAAGTAILLVGAGVAMDTTALTVVRFVGLVPAEYRPFLVGLTAVLAVLLPIAAAAAAAAAVSWSDAARREEAMLRAIGTPGRRIRRQQALQGVLVALSGSMLGVWGASVLLERLVVMLGSADSASAATALAVLRAAPGPAAVALPVAVGITAALAFASTLRRRPIIAER